MQSSAASNSKFPLGSKLPEFSLKNVDGKMIGSEYFRGAAAGLVVFTCNHCPYVKGSEEMLVKIVTRFQPLGLRTVTINSNDAAKYPEDSYEMMQEKSKRLKLPYPYLHDITQETARLFDSACTPECFLFDAMEQLVFHGAFTDNPREASADRADYLSKAIDQLLKGEPVKPSFVHPIGCSIKWR